ncbi:Ribosomal large subunit pseudouridine synthase B [subsurface metagenome]
MPMERLQKILAASGLGSRRACEELIVQGRVTVDGKPATTLGDKADSTCQKIHCDGELVKPAKKVYLLVNKPVGYVCTNDDERGRPRVVDLLPLRNERLFTIGRLDADTEGLIIVTNDGSFTQRVAHPRYGVTKTYHAQVRGMVIAATCRELTTGVWLAGRRCCAARAKILKRRTAESTIEITMHEGRNREVRRMLAKTGHPVLRLKRIRIGSIKDASLLPGKARSLRKDEIEALLGETKRKPAKGKT